MLCIYKCGLLVLDLIFDREEVFKQMDGLTQREKYFFLKGYATLLGDKESHKLKLKIIKKIVAPKIKVLQCPNNFHSFGHHLSGANFHIFSYKDERIRNLIWQMKFNENYTVAKLFGYCLAKNILDVTNLSLQIDEIFSDNSYLVPIPIHWRRLLERGYNQTHWLCQEVLKNIHSKNFGYPHKIKYSKSILKRSVYSKKQSWTDNDDRAKNIMNAFSIGRRARKIIAGANIILVDDVFTTGATINEASKILKEAGAKNVISFTIAR